MQGMSVFTLLRQARHLVRTVLAGFVLTLTCAIAAPAIHPQSMAMVCGAAGEIKLVALGDTGEEAPANAHHTLDCVLCLVISAPPSAPVPGVHAMPLVAAPVPPEPAGTPDTRSAAPPPARGPPVLS